MARVLVLGGTRFLGPPIVEQLLNAGHEVTIFHRGETEPATTASAEHVHGDFASLPDHVAALATKRPEVVLDVVPYIGKGGHGVRHFRGIADRAVVVTSQDVYRAFAVAWGRESPKIEAMPIAEDAPLRSAPSPDLTEAIDFDNLEVEHALGADARLPVTVLRLPIVYGACDPQRRLARYVRRMADRRPAILLDARIAERRWSRSYVENAAAAVVLAVADERAAGMTFNVASPETPTEADWVRLIADCFGWGGDVLAVPSNELPAPLRSRLQAAQDLFVTTERIRALGYEEPVSLRDGLSRAIAWEREQERTEHPPDYAAEDAVIASLRE